MNDNNNLKHSNDAIKDSALPSFKPTKRVSPETDNHLIKMLDAMVNGLEQSLANVHIFVVIPISYFYHN